MELESKLINDHMVIQAMTEFKIKLKTEPNEVVQLLLDDVHISSETADKNGFTTLYLSGQKYSQLDAQGRKISIRSDSASIDINDVIFGDVYVYLGQSNAGKPRVSANVARTREPNVRVYRDEWLDNPGEHPLAFAGEMARSTGRQIGLINESVGGSRIEQWNSRLSNNYRIYVKPIAGYPVRAIIWWQGEGNAANPLGYGAKLSRLIQEYRIAWGSPVPFFVIKVPTGSEPFTKLAQIMHDEYRDLPVDTYVVDTNGLIGGANGHIHPSDYAGYADRIADKVLGI